MLVLLIDASLNVTGSFNNVLHVHLHVQCTVGEIESCTKHIWDCFCEKGPNTCFSGFFMV